MRKEKHSGNSQTSAIWHLLYLVLTVLYFELLLYVTTGGHDLRSFGYILVFSISYGVLLAALASLPFGRWLNLFLLLALMLLTGTEYFLYQSFQTYMDFAAIRTAASDVAGGFTDTLTSMIAQGWWIILLFALPVLGYGILGGVCFSRPKHPWLVGVVCLLIAALFQGLGIYSVHQNDADLAKYSRQFEYSAACQHFGLLTGTRLDIQYTLLGNDSATELQEVTIPEPEPEPEPPTLPEETELEPVPEPEPEYGEQVMDLDLEMTDVPEAVSSLNQYIANQSGTKENEYTGLFAGKNLIFITAESFSAEVIDPVRTPTLYRLATEGIEFTDYYQPAWGGSTSTGEYSNVTGLIPVDGVSSIQKVSDHNLYFTLGNQLQRLGYYSAAYHNGSYTYYNRHQTHQNLGYSSFTGMGNGMEAGVKDQWPESDLEMMQFTIQDYIDQQPFSIYYMTVSGHGTYQQGANAMTKKNWETVSNMDASDTVKGYYAANMELEYAMDYLVEQLEAAGIADDTVIVLATDHYPYALEASNTWGNSTNYLPELYGYADSSAPARDHSDLIIWSGDLAELDLRVDSPTYSLDIVPTVSNLFGLEYDSRLLVGRDALSQELPLVIWRDHSWKTDRGFYNANTQTFTPNEGQEADQNYIDSVNALVQNKFVLSNVVLQYDYYRLLFGADEDT